MNLISNGNNGSEIASTDYWDSDYAKKGLMYASANSGVLRLLVPANQEHALSEMRTGEKVTVEKSIVQRGALDFVFEDGTKSPFCVTMDRRQFYGIPKRGAWGFSVWTQKGKQIEFDCQVKSTGN